MDMATIDGCSEVVLEHRDGLVRLTSRGASRRHVTVELFDPSVFVSVPECVTSYPLELIEAILAVKGPAWLCYSLRREESGQDVELVLRHAIFAFIDEHTLDGRRLLDFGCGSGASTLALTRLLPETEVVGIDIADDQLEIARLRARHYGVRQVRFLRSSMPDDLPPGIGEFDAVLLSAVFEHMLPAERTTLLPKIWSHLSPNGILFLNQTPHRYFPIEHHTTGLPLLNYLPDRVALRAARRFSRRVEPDATWQSLLRAGVRGGTAREVLRTLANVSESRPVLLKPSRLGARSAADIWYGYSMARNPRPAKRIVRLVFKAIEVLTAGAFAPDLNLAIVKRGSAARASS